MNTVSTYTQHQSFRRPIEDMFLFYMQTSVVFKSNEEAEFTSMVNYSTN